MNSSNAAKVVAAPLIDVLPSVGDPTNVTVHDEGATIKVTFSNGGLAYWDDTEFLRLFKVL